MITTKRIKYILWAIMFLTAAGVLIIFAGYRYFVKNPVRLLPTIAGQADMTLNNIEHSASQNGKEQWRLHAKTGRIIEARKEAILDDLAVVFYLQDGSKIQLTAARGVLNTDSNDIDISGKVAVNNRWYRLETEHIIYNHAEQILRAVTPVKISGRAMVITSDGMAIDLNTQLASLNGDVKGTLYEKQVL